MNKKIAILGSNGQLGKELIKIFEQKNQFDIVPLYRTDIDISILGSVTQYFENKYFDIIVNAAAYTAVDLAESDEATCYQCNEDAVKELAHYAHQNNCLLIHVSTDFVFDGSKSSLLNEQDVTNPLQVYGASKLAGEQWNKQGITIRTSWLYAAEGKNFLNTMLRLGSEREQITVVCNQIGTPTFAGDLASVICRFCEIEDYKAYKGIYHYSNEGVASWYDFAAAIMEYAKLSCKVIPIKDTDYPTPAKRPLFSVMDKTKIKELLKIEIPHWRDSLTYCVNQKKENEN